MVELFLHLGGAWCWVCDFQGVYFRIVFTKGSHSILRCSIYKVSPVSSEAAKAKIRGMKQSDIPIEKRRALYNQMSRQFKNPTGLKPGLLQKYNACLQSKKDRFTLLKEFIIDSDMFLT